MLGLSQKPKKWRNWLWHWSGSMRSTGIIRPRGPKRDLVKKASRAETSGETPRYIDWVRTQPTVLPRVENKGLIRIFAAIVKYLRSATFLQRNVVKSVKINVNWKNYWIAFAKVTILPANSILSTKRTADSLLQNKLEKKRKEKDAENISSGSLQGANKEGEERTCCTDGKLSV